MKFFLLIIFTSVCGSAYTQQQDSWTVRAGENMKAILGDSVVFKYSAFTPGFVYFRDETISTAPMNVSFVNSEVQFITEKKDTLTIANEGTVKFITINADTFYFDRISKGFVELVYANATARLGRQVKFSQSDVKKIGGYGLASSTSAINAAPYFSNGNQISRLSQNKLLLLQKTTTYFVGDAFGRFLPATKRNLRTMFNQQQAAIDQFLKENKNVFSNEEALKQLIDLLGK